MQGICRIPKAKESDPTSSLSVRDGILRNRSGWGLGGEEGTAILLTVLFFI